MTNSLRSADWTAEVQSLGRFALEPDAGFSADGLLSWDPHLGAKLLLNASNSQILSGDTPSTICGLVDNTYVTLGDCRVVNSSLSSPGPSQRGIAALGGILVGYSTTDLEEPAFDRISVWLRGIEDVTPGIAELRWPSAEEAPEQTEPVTVLSAERERVAHLPDGVTVHLRTRATATSSGAELSWSPVLSVSTPNPVGLSEMVKHLPLLSGLVTFLRGKPAGIRRVDVSGPELSGPLDGSRTERGSATLFRRFAPTPTQTAEAGQAHFPLALLNSQEQRFDRVVQEWAAVSERLKPVVNLRLGSINAGFMYAENRFTNAVQAVEALDRRIHAHEKNEQAASNRAAVLASVGQEHRQWLETVLEHVDEPRLRQRVDRLLRAASTRGIELSGSRRKWITERTIRVRNYLTHWDGDDHAAVDGTEMRALAEILGLAVDLAIASELGLTDEQLADTVKKRRNVSWALGLLDSVQR